MLCSALNNIHADMILFVSSGRRARGGATDTSGVAVAAPRTPVVKSDSSMVIAHAELFADISAHFQRSASAVEAIQAKSPSEIPREKKSRSKNTYVLASTDETCASRRAVPSPLPQL